MPNLLFAPPSSLLLCVNPITLIQFSILYHHDIPHPSTNINADVLGSVLFSSEKRFHLR